MTLPNNRLDNAEQDVARTGRARGSKRDYSGGPKTAYNTPNKSSFESRRSGQSKRQRPHRQHYGPSPKHMRNSRMEESPAKQLKCSVCGEADNPKYKCPRCRSTYCSVACCQKHKEKPCATPSEIAPSQKSKYIELHKTCRDLKPDASLVQTQRALGSENFDPANDDPELQITQAMVNAMHSSAWLHDELQDDGLRHLILQVLAASTNVLSRSNSTVTHQQALLSKLQSDHPPFKEFLDKLLLTCGILEQNSVVNSSGNVAAQGPSNTLVTLSPLVLKPPPSRQRQHILSEGVQALDDSESSSSSSASSSDDDSISTQSLDDDKSIAAASDEIKIDRYEVG